MKIFHLEANGRTNTGEYVHKITKTLSILSKKNVKVFTSSNSVHSGSLDVFSGYARSNKYKKLYYYYQGWRRLTSTLKRENEECIFHVHWLRFSPIDYFYLKKLNRQKNIRLIFTVHNILPHETMSFDMFFYQKLYSLFDHLIFHSEQNIIDFNSLFQNCGAKQSIIPHYSYEVAPNIPPNEGIVKILFFGAIRPYKGLELLIAALKKVDHFLKWELTIAGKPEYDISQLRGEVERDNILNERIKWKTGWIEDEAIPAIFQECHIAVLPYLNIDNSGLVHLAMSYGKTVLVPDIGVFKDLIEEDKNGYFFKCNNIDSLSAKLNTIIEKDNFEIVGKAAIEKMKEHSIENIGASLLKVYNQVR